MVTLLLKCVASITVAVSVGILCAAGVGAARDWYADRRLSQRIRREAR